MEVYNPTQYSFSELYLQILPEGRIRRRQYIGRMVGGGLLIGIILWGIRMALGGMFNSTIITLLNIGGVIIGGIMWYALNSKRIRDIGKNPQAIQKITLALIAGNIISSLYIYAGESGWITNYVNGFRRAMAELLGNTIPLPWHQVAMDYISIALGLVAIIVFLYLFLVPGKTGDNELGKDPINTKLGFFG